MKPKDRSKIGLFLMALLGCILFVGGIVNAQNCMESPETCNIQTYAGPSISVDGNEITVTVYLKMVGNYMGHDAIIELQPREPGLLPLWLYPQQFSCDLDNHPENIHRYYALSYPGDQFPITLKTNVPEGTYNLWLLSLDKCYDLPPEGNVGMSPYQRGTVIGTVTVTGTEPTECTPGETDNCVCDTLHLQQDIDVIMCDFCGPTGVWRDGKTEVEDCYQTGGLWGECNYVNGIPTCENFATTTTTTLAGPTSTTTTTLISGVCTEGEINLPLLGCIDMIILGIGILVLGGILLIFKK